MNKLIAAGLLGVGLMKAATAAAYPVDCAILLCLAGGWPASAECVHARAVFIRRITPWPIEPPLQIWNCPMRASFRRFEQPLDRFYDIAFRVDAAEPALSLPQGEAGPILVDAQADVDISGPAFDFVRSIKVFEITYYQHRGADGDCTSRGKVYLGRYGPQGAYSRNPSDVSIVPVASDLEVPADCRDYRYRSVFVEWRDSQGNYGFEEVHY